MNLNAEQYDLVLTGGWVIDPSQSTNGRFDVGVRHGKIADLAPNLPADRARQVLDVGGHLVCPGFIDPHVHVYEWVTDFGLKADEVGIHSGATTVVDQGSCGAWTFQGFKAYVCDQSRTDVRCFLSINLIGALRGGLGGPVLQSPQMVDVNAIVDLARQYPELVRGIKCHGESGALSRWGLEVLKLAREAGDRTGLPLYIHTGELIPVIKENRPAPDDVLAQVLPLLRPGDILAHCYSNKPDGLLGKRTEVPDWLIAAAQSGIRLDLGHGINFSFAIARRMMAAGLLPDTLGSDVHGDFDSVHNDTTLDYSLCGALSKLLALGMPLERVIAAVTFNPARVLGAERDIGTLQVGSRADISVLQKVAGNWVFRDCEGETVTAKEQLIPAYVVREGALIQPDRRLLRDLSKL
ncbi:MAG TPA: amidohydrolase/deacetylase family metallohydrolase [Candidatus Binatia bacterium]|nr:amidohydrolase/deacetylase family metallohydrolase [Candidatus Binatia bacterium]